MTSVSRTWSQWAGEVANRAGEIAGAATEAATEAVKDAYEDSPVDVAVDYWATRTPEQATRQFRDSADEFVSEHLGAAAGKVARLGVAPLGAAARFSVQGMQGFDAVASKTRDIATGRAAMPTPGEVIFKTVTGVAGYAKQTADTALSAATDGFTAAVAGDVEGVAAAAENAAKAALDTGALVAGGRGMTAGAKSTFGGGGVLQTAGVGSTVTGGTAGALAGAGQMGVAAGALGVVSQAPMEARGRRTESGGGHNKGIEGKKGGGKTGRKRNMDRVEAAQKKLDEAINTLKELKSRPPFEGKSAAIDKAKQQIKHWTQKVKEASENHAQRTQRGK
ncbi:MAG: hypothetical protein AAFU77_04180 [Myxococcota bacterium]